MSLFSIKTFFLAMQGLDYEKAVMFNNNKKTVIDARKKLYKKVIKATPLNGYLNDLLGDKLTVKKVFSEHEELFADFSLDSHEYIKHMYNCDMPIIHIVHLYDDNRDKVVNDFYVEKFSYEDEKFSLCAHSKDICFEDDCFLKAKELSSKVGSYFAEAVFLDFSFIFTNKGVRFVNIDTDVKTDYINLCSEDAFKALESIAINVKKRSIWKRFAKYFFTLLVKKKGFMDFMYRNWIVGLYKDWKYPSTSLSKRIWANKRGFYSYRIEQYGLTKDNYKDFLSDYDYKRLRPLNGTYQKWLWNKITAYFILKPGAEDHLPKYYFRICKRGKKTLILPFDYEEGYKSIASKDVVDLIRDKKMMVLKPAVGSHGKGFYKMAYDEAADIFICNDKIYDEKQMMKVIDSLNRNYIATEYIYMHDDLRKIYTNVTGTIRIMTILEDKGTDPVKYAYFRIGTNSTGNTDNLDSGGLVAKVNVATGKFGSAELLKDHKYVLQEVHPNTGAKIEGYLPNWENVKKEIRSLCLYLRPLEYLGYDIALTNDGFKIIEINTHPDLHKIYEYPEDAKAYFRGKLNEKNDTVGRTR